MSSGVKSGFALCLEYSPRVMNTLFAETAMGLKTESKMTKNNRSNELLPICFSRNTAFDKEV